MAREVRLRPAGMLFYVVLASSLLMTQAGQGFLFNLLSQSTQADIYQAVAAILGVGALLFTSEGVGYVFETMHFFIWNVVRGRFQQGKGGFSAEWERLGYNRLKSHIIDQYESASKTPGGDGQHQKFEKQWKTYSADVFLSYFWQQAPVRIVNWAGRRNDAFIAGMSNVIGIALGLVVSLIVIWAWNMGWTVFNTCITIALALLILMICWNAQYARNEAWQIVDLWLAGILNPRLHAILNNIQTEMSADPGSSIGKAQ